MHGFRRGSVGTFFGVSLVFDPGTPDNVTLQRKPAAWLEAEGEPSASRR